MLLLLSMLLLVCCCCVVADVVAVVVLQGVCEYLSVASRSYSPWQKGLVENTYLDKAFKDGIVANSNVSFRANR